MPWNKTDAMTERTKFVLEWYRRWDEGEGRVNIAALCRAFGISRETGYVWVRRFRDGGHQVASLAERSRRPKTNPRQVDAAMEDGIVRLKKQYPYWGPRKLKAWLEQRRPEYLFPAASTIGEVLKRNGLVRKRRKRQKTPPHTSPFAACGRPNDTWCVDFKGNFRVGDGSRCFPLTIMDAHSRFLLRCEGLEAANYKAVRPVFESAFEEFGLPEVIRSDNGSPFATKGAGGLSELSAWWVRLGIRPERIEPGKPQQNGRHERMHLTLKKETALPPRASMLAQQRRFDAFRREYNDERPHEARTSPGVRPLLRGRDHRRARQVSLGTQWRARESCSARTAHRAPSNGRAMLGGAVWSDHLGPAGWNEGFTRTDQTQAEATKSVRDVVGLECQGSHRLNNRIPW